ncbi:uncharacterized, partial [Tachysurus ichikawai]
VRRLDDSFSVSYSERVSKLSDVSAEAEKKNPGIRGTVGASDVVLKENFRTSHSQPDTLPMRLS